MIYVNEIRVFGMAIAIAILVACKSAGAPVPKGQISLSYRGVVNSNYVFMLENRSTQAVYFRATKELGEDPKPWDTAMQCTSAGSSIPDDAPIPFVDGGPVDNIKVSPGERLRLNIQNSDIIDKRPFAVRYKGGHCHLRVQLLKYGVIESNEFQP